VAPSNDARKESPAVYRTLGSMRNFLENGQRLVRLRQTKLIAVMASTRVVSSISSTTAPAVVARTEPPSDWYVQLTLPASALRKPTDTYAYAHIHVFIITIWNSTSLPVFCTRLKTYFFELCYS